MFRVQLRRYIQGSDKMKDYSLSLGSPVVPFTYFAIGSLTKSTTPKKGRTYFNLVSGATKVSPHRVDEGLFAPCSAAR